MYTYMYNQRTESSSFFITDYSIVMLKLLFISVFIVYRYSVATVDMYHSTTGTIFTLNQKKVHLHKEPSSRWFICGFIDFKTPFVDDYDARIIYGGSNLQITTIADQPILLKHNNSTVLTTSSTGIDVTGEVTTDGLTSSSTILVQESDSTTRAIRLTSDANEGFLQVYKAGVQKVQIRGDGNNFILITILV